MARARARDAASSSLVFHIDFDGALMEFFGLKVPRTLEGGSMLPLLNDTTATVRKEVFIEWGRYGVDHDGFSVAAHPLHLRWAVRACRQPYG